MPEEDVMRKLTRIQEMLLEENIGCDIIADPETVAYISIQQESHEIQLICQTVNGNSSDGAGSLIMIVSVLEDTIGNDDMRRLILNEFNAVSNGGTACPSADGNNIIMRQSVICNADGLTNERLNGSILLFAKYLLVLKDLLDENSTAN
jgi:hypothetical protein